MYVIVVNLGMHNRNNNKLKKQDIGTFDKVNKLGEINLIIIRIILSSVKLKGQRFCYINGSNLDFLSYNVNQINNVTSSIPVCDILVPYSDGNFNMMC